MIRLKGAWPLIFRTAIFISCLTLSILIGQRAAIRRFTLSANQPENTILDHTILIPAGKFIMGSDTGRVDEAPSHQVYLDAFWIDQFEVTNWEYHKFILETGISNLTKDTAPALVHFEDGQTQQWLLVRLEEPEGQSAQ